MSELNKKLAEIQLHLSAGKDQKNNFSGWNFRSAESIIQAVKPLLGDSTITLTDDIVQVGDRYYIKATATLTLYDESVSTQAFAREALSKKGLDDAQVSGTCSSYSRKYALCGLLLIDDNKEVKTSPDMDDIDNAKHPSQSQAEVDAAEFLALFEAKKLDGIIDLWQAARLNKERFGLAWPLLHKEVQKIISEAKKGEEQ